MAAASEAMRRMMMNGTPMNAITRGWLWNRSPPRGRTLGDGCADEPDADHLPVAASLTSHAPALAFDGRHTDGSHPAPNRASLSRSICEATILAASAASRAPPHEKVSRRATPPDVDGTTTSTFVTTVHTDVEDFSHGALLRHVRRSTLVARAANPPSRSLTTAGPRSISGPVSLDTLPAITRSQLPCHLREVLK